MLYAWQILPQFSYGQASPNQNTLRLKSFVYEGKGFRIDSFLVEPSSILVLRPLGLKYQFSFQEQLFQPEGLRLGDTIQLSYRVFPYPIGKERRLVKAPESDSLRWVELYSMAQPRAPNATLAEDKREEIFATPNIRKNGSLTRGVSFGNNQNVFVNSALNLQMEGQLSEDISLTALISDQQIPFQPQGNTANVRELDRVLISLKHKYATLDAGDIVIQNGESAFLRYYKNVQGVSLSTQFGEQGKNRAVSKLSAGFAKGKFASINVDALEGVQGPYRLRVPGSSEAFIIIMANTERVYLDNRLLQRGYQQDYVIDYNLGEITFMPKILVTRFSRIRVDFEYAERNYSRTIISARHEQQVGAKLKVWGNVYQEADLPERPLGFPLTEENRNILGLAGDSLQQAVISGAIPVSEFSRDQVLYFRRDTVVNGQRDSVFVLAVNPPVGTALFSVVFTEVLQGQGDYVLVPAIANGRIYRFVGRGQGNFIAKRQLATPNRRAMLSTGAQLSIDDFQEVSTELSLSNFNANLYSFRPIDKNGDAQKISYKLKALPLSENWRLGSVVGYERLSKNFNGIDRFRYIEFDRDWNARAGDTSAADDHLISSRVELKRAQQLSIYGGHRYRNKQGNTNGHQLEGGGSFNTQLLTAQTDWFVLNGQGPTQQNEWVRGNFSLTGRNRFLQPVYKYSTDRNAIFRLGTDTVVGTAMNFDEHSFRLQRPDSVKNPFYLQFSSREDRLPIEGRLNRFSAAQTLEAGWQLRSKRGNYINLTGLYRKFDPVSQGGNTITPPEETFQARVDWAGDYLNRHLRQEFTLNAGTGRELRREFRFIRITQVGEGTHQWIDVNGDGIAQLDEFVEAQRPEDRQYIKIFVPTSEFISAFSTNIQYRFNWQAPRSWANTSGLKGFLGKFSQNNSFSLDRRTQAEGWEERFSPFVSLTEALLVAERQNWRSTLFYNRISAKYGAELSYFQTLQKSFLTGGFDTRKTEEWRAGFRANLSSIFSTTIFSSTGYRQAISDFLGLNNFRIGYQDITPELAWQPSPMFRWAWNYQLQVKNNPQQAMASNSHRVSTEVRLNKVNVRNITATVRYFSIDFSGNEVLPAAYEMLDGLRPGNNITWTLNLQQKLFDGLQLGLNYEGRQSPGLNIVHIGRVQVTALF